MARSASITSGRYIDLAISVRIADVDRDASGRPHWRAGSDAELCRVGGRWDRRKRRWAPGIAKKLLVLRFHRGQEAAARWMALWLRAFVTNVWTATKRAWSALFIGGRRSGKTHLVLAMFVVFGVMNPGARMWAISPTLETGDELDQGLRELLPRGWYIRRQAKTGRATTFLLTNGTRILLKSAVKPERLKAGRVDMALLNEAQELSQRAYVKLRGAIVDRGGIVLMTANPPEAPIGRWVEEHYVAALHGKIEGVVFELNPEANPWVQHEGLMSMAAEVDEKTFDRDVLGLFPPIGDVVHYGWSDRDSIRVPDSSWVDITAEITLQRLGHAAAYLVLMDFQKTPAMVALVRKAFRDPARPGEVYMVTVDEAIVDDATEEDLLDALEAIPRWQVGDGPPDTRDGDGYRGWIEASDDRANPVHCAVVMDASAWWQDGEHSKTRNSDKRCRARRWVHLYRPRPEKNEKGELLRNNPPVSERVKLTNSRLKTKDGHRRSFSAPWCKGTNKSMRDWENSKITAQPNKNSVHAHVGDAWGYGDYRLFGAVTVKKNPGKYVGLRRQRVDEMRAW